MSTTKIKYLLPALATSITLFGYISTPSARAQAQDALTQQQSPEQQLADAKAALAKAQSDATKQTDCRSLSGVALAACNHVAASQASERNKRVAAAQMLVQRLQTQINTQAATRNPSETTPAVRPSTTQQPNSSPQVAPVAQSYGQTAGKEPTVTATTATSSTQTPIGPASVGSQRFDVIHGGLFIDIPGTGYPDGYGPDWDVTKTPRNVIATRSVAGSTAVPSHLSVGFISESGHPEVTFAIPGFASCTADLAGLPQAITTTPRRFDIVNIHGADRYCTPASYRGWLLLSTNSVGDILASVDLTTHLGKSANEMHFVGTDTKFTNSHTQQWAQNQAKQKAEQAALDAKLLKQDEDKLGHKLSPLEQTLSLDWDADITKSEFQLVNERPVEYAQLCLQHNPRACFAVRATVELSDMSYLLGTEQTTWSKANSQTVLSAITPMCVNETTSKYHTLNCDAVESLKYAMILKFGPKELNLAHCLSIAATTNATQKVYTDSSGNESYGSVKHQITGNDLENVCAFSIDFSSSAYSKSQTLKPHEVTHIDAGVVDSMFNMNSLNVRWIKRH